MAVSEVSDSIDVGTDWKQYAAGAADLIADSTTGKAARRIVMLAAGDLSPCVNSKGVNRALTSLPAGFVHEANVQSCTGSVAFIAYW